MTQQHLDRLSPIDASFLHQEGPDAHMHVGALTTFEGPPPPIEDVRRHVRSRLHLVPRYRQRLEFPAMQTGRPLWVDDPSFNLEYHVRHTALPAPGTEDQLLRLAARVFSQRLDRERPLWEMWMVEGLRDNEFAILSKTHHSLVDGIAGVDIATVLFDLTPTPPPAEEGLEPWQPEPEPSTAQVLATGVKGLVHTGAKLTVRALGAATRPGWALGAAREAAEGLGELAWVVANPAPETPLNVEIGPHRRYSIVRNELERFKYVKDVLGGTVNDVVLTIVAGALAEWLHGRGVRTEGLELRALVPVSIRTESQQDTLGNQIAVMRGPLPVYIKDPVARLRVVRQAMDGLKESKQAVGAEVLTRAQGLAPPTVLAQASRLNFSTRLFNLIVTNVPGPQFPLYVLGRELRDLFPVAFLPRKHALAIAIMSYNGQVNFGLLGDYDALPDIEVIAEGLSSSLAALVKAADKRAAAKAPARERAADRRRDGKGSTGTQRKRTRA